jgi:hypothetical protein
LVLRWCLLAILPEFHFEKRALFLRTIHTSETSLNSADLQPR